MVCNVDSSREVAGSKGWLQQLYLLGQCNVDKFDLYSLQQALIVTVISGLAQERCTGTGTPQERSSDVLSITGIVEIVPQGFAGLHSCHLCAAYSRCACVFMRLRVCMFMAAGMYQARVCCQPASSRSLAASPSRTMAATWPATPTPTSTQQQHWGAASRRLMYLWGGWSGRIRS